MRYIPCRCFCAEHFLRFSEDPDLPGELEVSVVSSRNGSFWHRLKWAFVHVMGREDMIFADLIISREKLKEICDEQT